jgi:GT2 family glycosyltransferase
VLAGDWLPCELIVIDDSDDPNTALQNLRDSQCAIQYHWRHARGLSSAMNHAIEVAAHDIVAFTQDDAEVASDWLRTLVTALVDAGPRTIVTGRVTPGDPELDGAFVSDANISTGRETFRGRIDRDVLFALNMALFKAAHDDIGPFDERLGPGTSFPASEDNDYAYRALQSGYTILYEPRAVVRHRAWRGEEQYARFRFGYGFARGGYYAKHIHWRGDRYMLKRLFHDLQNHLTPLPTLIRQDRRTARGHISLACGLVAGAVRWKIDQARTLSQRRRATTNIARA